MKTRLQTSCARARLQISVITDLTSVTDVSDCGVETGVRSVRAVYCVAFLYCIKYNPVRSVVWFQDGSTWLIRIRRLQACHD